jgi:hypothetical protein
MKYMKKFSSIQNNIRSTRKNPKYGFRGYPRLNENSKEDENNNQNNKMDNNMGNNTNNNILKYFYIFVENMILNFNIYNL